MDWKNDIRQGFDRLDLLMEFLGWPNAEQFCNSKHYPLFIPFSLANRIKELGPQSSLAKQFLPQSMEDADSIQTIGLQDPIADQKYSPVPGLVHRYHNRALFFPTQTCPVQCRYCFRKNELGQGLATFRMLWDGVENYLKQHTEIEEIIFSGGDPFMLDDDKLDDYLSRLQKIPSIRYVRFHTRILTALPARTTQTLIDILKHHRQNFDDLVVVFHLNHADELDHSTVRDVMSLWQKSGLQLLAQSVLLKGINDSVAELEELFRRLNRHFIRPYYLHHPDLVAGAMHFYLSVEEGKNLFHPLRRKLPGWMLPQYVIESPDGAGKTLV